MSERWEGGGEKREILCHRVGDGFDEVAVELCGSAANAGFATVTF